MVKALTAAGTLETLQLINRQLTRFPDELRSCHNLKYLSIVNCAIEELPIWAKEFHNLEFLQFRGGSFQSHAEPALPAVRSPPTHDPLTTNGWSTELILLNPCPYEWDYGAAISNACVSA
ncbi:hypothetical protein PInf_020345 [Phytophthora infestans]|nr:hypothetical protein PInf_020345 [Phytophthora infestans]